jgi:hypothetical protein
LIIISFENDRLHDLCVDLARAETEFGTVSAGELVNVISDANACENARELIDFMGPKIEITDNDSLCVMVAPYWRFEFVVVGQRFSLNTDGRIDWSSVARLKLVAISRER